MNISIKIWVRELKVGTGRKSNAELFFLFGLRDQAITHVPNDL